MSKFSIKKNRPGDLPKILDFLKSKNKTTPRSKESWFGCKMVSMNLWRRKKLVGIIPLEPREFKINKNFSIRTLWHTTVYIVPELRSKGFGTKMVQRLTKEFSSKFDGLFVYRHDEKSPAYLWYQKTGHYHLLPIRSLKLVKEKFRDFPRFTDYYVLYPDEITSNSLRLYQVFNNCYRDFGGFSNSRQKFLGK